VEETSFAVEGMLHDPTAHSIMENAKLSVEEAVSLGRSVSSIRVYAAKPK
jgi:hypothetical protein